MSRRSWRAVAACPLLGFAGRTAADPPAPDPAESLRQELLAAYRKAESVNRAYEVLVDGTVKGRLEVYRKGKALAVHGEWPGATVGVWDAATDGTDLIVTSDLEPQRHRADVGPRWRKRDAAFDAVVAALCHLYGLPPPPRADSGFTFELCLPQTSARDGASGAGARAVWVGIDWRARAEPTWLAEEALVPRSGGPATGPDAVPARIEGFDAVLSKSDAFPSFAEGTLPGTTSRWTLREAVATLSPEEWEARIADLFDESVDPIVDGSPGDLVALWYVAMSLHRLSGLPDSPFHAPAALHAALEMLFTCAWADTDTTFAWWAEVRAARAELSGEGGAPTESAEEREARERSARADLTQTIYGRLFGGAMRAGWIVLAPVRGQGREWIARRIDLLWSESVRREARRGGR